MGTESDYNFDAKRSIETDFVKVAESGPFKKLIQERKRFIFPLTIFFLLFYFLLPILTSYTTILRTPAIGDISWAWIYAFAQFIMTWVLCTVYVKKSASFDRQSKQLMDDMLEKEREAK
ncbi:DUF485 domain-containing protein [Oceanobacillus rekensis]|uniref:DUF485 domain-containing protein n=1 Tax=Oceanobacillus rekensis TaxID=937927 RepID=UPI000B443BA3|nr:DUF485 domain-containing protein [Oceanobacillus rekensis]